MTPCTFVGANSISEEHAVRGPKTTYLLMLLIGFEADTGWLVEVFISFANTAVNIFRITTICMKNKWHMSLEKEKVSCYSAVLAAKDWVGVWSLE
jgi:hypothetical protein